MFRTQYKGGYAKKEANHGKRMVETAGYIPAQKRIEQIMQAGQRLMDYRKEQFDFWEQIDESFHDPTRDPNFDMADAFRLAEEANARIRAHKIELEQASKIDSKATQDPVQGSETEKTTPA